MIVVWFLFSTAAVSRLNPKSIKISLEEETLLRKKEMTQVKVAKRNLSSTSISRHAIQEALHMLMVVLQRKF